MANQSQANPNYDRGITPAEVAARQKREGENYGKIPEEKGVDATDGYTIDREGKLNNYAIEPEMYYEVRGDRREIKEAEKAQRVQELKELNEPGGKGPGVI